MKPRNMLIILASFVLLIVMACDPTTKPKLGDLQGHLMLSGLSDNSGIIVMLYPKISIPDEASNIIDTRPDFASVINPKSFFDHRRYIPIFQTITDVNGYFEFSRVEYGEYIIAYYKEDWGYNYLFDIILNSTVSNIDHTYSTNIRTLNPVVHLNAVLEGDYYFESGVCYFANEDVTVLENATISFSNNSKLILAPGVKLRVFGLSLFPLDVCDVVITSSSGVYGGFVPNVERAHSIEFFHSDASVRNVQASYLNDGIVFRSENSHLTEAFLLHCEVGVSVVQTSDCLIENCVSVSSGSSDYGSIYIIDSEQVNVQKCLLINGGTAIMNRAYSDLHVSQCYFQNFDVVLVNTIRSFCDFSYNEILTSDIGIQNLAQSNVNISYNIIAATTGINAYSIVNYGNTIETGWIEGHFNNFNCSSYLIYATDIYLSPQQSRVLDFTNNYWGLVSEEQISSKIIDNADLDGTSQYVYADIAYMPYRNMPVSNAGVPSKNN